MLALSTSTSLSVEVNGMQSAHLRMHAPPQDIEELSPLARITAGNSWRRPPAAIMMPDGQQLTKKNGPWPHLATARLFLAGLLPNDGSARAAALANWPVTHKLVIPSTPFRTGLSKVFGAKNLASLSPVETLLPAKVFGDASLRSA